MQASGSVVVKPPRPPNAWILYRSDKVKLIPTGPPGARKPAQGDVSKQISVMWRNESEEVRQEYERRAEVKKLAHSQEYPDYRFNPMKKEVKEAMKQEAKNKKDQKRAEKLNRGRHSAAPSTVPIPAMAGAAMPDIRYGPGGPSPPMFACASPEPVPHLRLDANENIPNLQLSQVQTVTPPLSQHSSRSSSYERPAVALSLPSPPQYEPAWNQANHQSYVDMENLNLAENALTVSYSMTQAEQIFQQSIADFMTSHGSSIFGMGDFDPTSEDLSAEFDVDVAVGNIGAGLQVEVPQLPAADFDQYAFLTQGYTNTGYNVEQQLDITNLGQAGMSEAFNNFDPSRKFSFSDFVDSNYADSSRAPSTTERAAPVFQSTNVHYAPPSGAAQSSNRRVAGSWQLPPPSPGSSNSSP